MTQNAGEKLIKCPICGEFKEKLINLPLLDGSGRVESRKVGVCCKCDMDETNKKEERLKFEEDQRNINKLKQVSLMDKRLMEVSFETFKKNMDNEKVLKLAYKYVTHFDVMYNKGQGILFFGDVGTGKSYAAAMIANELIKRQQSVVMTSFVNLLRNNGWDDGGDDRIDKINRAKLLIIDDLGAERDTDFALEKVYDIVDSRYRSKKPVIITTNLELRDMQQCTDVRYSRIYDRIFEMCYPVKIDGRSWRKKNAVNRFDEMRRLFDE